MKYLLVLLSLNLFAAYPQFRYDDKVKVVTGGSEEYYFFNCSREGTVVKYFKNHMNNTYVYEILFKCGNVTRSISLHQTHLKKVKK